MQQLFSSVKTNNSDNNNSVAVALLFFFFSLGVWDPSSVTDLTLVRITPENIYIYIYIYIYVYHRIS